MNELTKQPDYQLMREVIQRIATGPELSKDLSEEQAEQAMRLVLEQSIDPVQSAIFLIALRMKRETDEENLGVLKAIQAATAHYSVDIEDLVDIFEPYNGYIRSSPISAFVPCILSACGLPAYSHGVELVGPKYGITHEQLFKVAGIDVSLSVEQAASRISNPEVGWTYLSQSQFCAPLKALDELRHKMVKRSVLTTVEGLAGALKATGNTHLVTGYVHKAYPRIYLDLAKAMSYHSALVLRGVEGGIVPGLRQAAKFHRYFDDELASGEIDPGTISINSQQRAVTMPDNVDIDSGLALSSEQRQELAKAILDQGQAVLSGQDKGLARSALIYSTALILWHCGKAENLVNARALAISAIDSGKAQHRFDAAING